MNLKRIADTAILAYLAWNAIDRTIEAKRYLRPTELDIAKEKWQTAYRECDLYRRKLNKSYGRKQIEALAEKVKTGTEEEIQGLDAEVKVIAIMYVELLRLKVESEKAFNEYQWRKGIKADKGKREKMRKEEEKRA